MNVIHNGAIDFYYGLKITTKHNYYMLCDKVAKKLDDELVKYNLRVDAIFQKQAEELIKEYELSDLRIKKNNNLEEIEKIGENTELEGELSGIEFDVEGNKLFLTPRTYVKDCYSYMSEESNFDFDYSKRIYGKSYVNSQNRFILPPIKIKLKNDEEDVLRAMLYIFENKFAVLRLTLPIDNLDAQSLKENDVDGYIKSARVLYGLPSLSQDVSISAFQDCYCRFLVQITEASDIFCFKKIVNILLAKHSDMVDNIKEMPDNLKEELYKISLAPIQERKGVSYINEAEEHINKNSYFFNGVGYVLSSMGKCISFVDNSVLAFVKENVDEAFSYNKVIADLRRNAEFAIIILLLKNINDGYTFEQKGVLNKSPSQVKKEFNNNKLFISNLQNGVYGSVRELTDKFSQGMRYFLDIENTEERMKALDSILEEEQAKRTLQLKNVISIGGLLFTTLFGLPAINDTVLHIRRLCFFIKHNVAYLSIANISFIIWCLTVISLFLIIFCKAKRRR